MKRFVAAAAVLAATSVSAEVRVGALIGDHMVVQQRKPVRLWGTAAANESVRVSLAGRQAATRADGAGRWQVTLRALPASGPHVLTIEGKKSYQAHQNKHQERGARRWRRWSSQRETEVTVDDEQAGGAWTAHRLLGRCGRTSQT
jgi:hypothetical protein